jgi:hypothetical protein
MRLTMLLALTEELRPFGADDVAKLRAEFLMIMKNVERVATYEAAVQLQDAMTTWRQHFTHTIDDIIAGIPEVTKGVGHDGYWKKEIGTGTWDMHIYFKLPLDTTDSEAHRWRGTTMRSATPEELFARFARERTKWAAKMKDAGRKAWTVLKKYLEWAAANAKGPVVKNSPPIEMATMAGFKSKLVGWIVTTIIAVYAAVKGSQ